MHTDYVETGISALASVHKSHPGAWFFGHTGAAILSGCFLLDEIPLATKGLQSFRKQVHLTRNTRIPTDSVPAKAVRTPDPMQLEFWLDRKADPHQIKLAYSLLSILKFVDEETRNEALHRIAPYWHLMS